MLTSSPTGERSPVFEISPAVQSYDWGKKGKNSRVAQFLAEIDDAKSYAELWMGTHPSGMCHVKKANPTDCSGDPRQAITSVVEQNEAGHAGASDQDDANNYNNANGANANNDLVENNTSKMPAATTSSTSSLVADEGQQKHVNKHEGQHVVRQERLPLLDVLQSDPDFYLGPATKSSSSSETRDLPFLFKVLSVGKALSIQVHPDKSLAEKLYREQPTVYKDPNHKPEIAIPLGPFEALMAFRPKQEILFFVETIPELYVLTGDIVAGAATAPGNGEDQQVVPRLYAALMHQNAETVKEQVHSPHHEVHKLVERLRRVESGEEVLRNDADATTSPFTPALQRLILRLNEEFPGDVGVFSVFFLNYVQADRGNFLFCEAFVPHAYLSGDCVECMALSDNVIRAGLTPKFKDVDLLLQCVKYNNEEEENALPERGKGEPTNLRRQPVILGLRGGGGGACRSTTPSSASTGASIKQKLLLYRAEGISDFQVLEIRGEKTDGTSGAGAELEQTSSRKSDKQGVHLPCASILVVAGMEEELQSSWDTGTTALSNFITVVVTEMNTDRTENIENKTTHPLRRGQVLFLCGDVKVYFSLVSECTLFLATSGEQEITTVAE
ncbi:unnamed protein product [Amoebophrya sp. A25]|nr:unnamed protein product [Amoebophrya sp. A25]|eukprot:GSA25T00003582001.1